MIPYSSNTTQQADVHEGFNPGHQTAWAGLAEKRERRGSPRMICDGSGGWDRVR